MLSGILNGIDETVWDPANDPHLAARFDVRRLNDRSANKTALQKRFGLDAEPASLLFGVVSRLTAQKGIDLLLEALPTSSPVARSSCCWARAILRSPRVCVPRRAISRSCRRAARYDEALAHLIQGGCDALLIPSRFEPCGLTQLCALRYGALPIVSRVGGLCDTVIDANEVALAAGVATGFQFAPVESAMLVGGDRTRTGRVAAAEPVAADAAQRHEHRRWLAPSGRALCRAISRAGALSG